MSAVPGIDRLREGIPRLHTSHLRLFAVDCAEPCVDVFERRFPTDYRLREAVRVSRAFALREADAALLLSAENDAWEALWMASGPSGWLSRIDSTRSEDSAVGFMPQRDPVTSLAWDGVKSACLAVAWAAQPVIDASAAWGVAREAARGISWQEFWNSGTGVDKPVWDVSWDDLINTEVSRAQDWQAKILLQHLRG